MQKILFYLKQLAPLTYWSKYKTPDSKKHLTIWSQWFGKPFNIHQFTLAD